MVSLKRFFTEGGDFIFLIDEAHNLVDRARDMYSAQLLKSAVYGVKKALGKGHCKLTAALNKVNSEMTSCAAAVRKRMNIGWSFRKVCRS